MDDASHLFARHRTVNLENVMFRQDNNRKERVIVVAIVTIRQALDEAIAWDVAGPYPFYRRMLALGYPEKIPNVWNGKRYVTLSANDIDKYTWKKFNGMIPQGPRPYELTDAFSKKFERAFPWLITQHTQRYRFLDTKVDSELGFCQMEYALVQDALQILLRLLYEMSVENATLENFSAFVFPEVAKAMQHRDDFIKWAGSSSGFGRRPPKTIAKLVKFNRDREEAQKLYDEEVAGMEQRQLSRKLLEAYPQHIAQTSLPFTRNASGVWVPDVKRITALAGVSLEVLAQKGNRP